ncbi:MAG TPA: DUF1963 domain-containing protein [Pyrinomonadaceae bacterium]|nr:DUF1963 domain-containing protein [Pyrinomonadaceae bacterium]
MEKEILELIPSLKEKTKNSIRVLPQQGDEPAVNATKIGGLFLWSENENWFCCDVIEDSLMEDYFKDYPTDSESQTGDWNFGYYKLQICEVGHSKHNDAFVPILQIRAEDIPLMRFPHNTNIFQLFWCPRYHKETYSPVCKIVWRNENEIENQLKIIPKASNPECELIPKPSAVILQEVEEYPNFWALSSEEKDLLTNEKREFYWKNLSPHEGIKVGGHPNWIQDPETPICNCNKEMEHLLTIGSDIFEDYPNHKAPGLVIGDCGSVYIFICYDCANLPIKTVFQCS